MAELIQLFGCLLFSLFLLFSTIDTKKPTSLFFDATIGIYVFSMVVDGLSSHVVSESIAPKAFYYAGLIVCTVASLLLIWGHIKPLPSRSKNQKQISIAAVLFSIFIVAVIRKDIPLQSLSFAQLLRKSSMSFMEELVYRYVLTYCLYDRCFKKYTTKLSVRDNGAWYLLCFIVLSNILFATAHFDGHLFLNHFIFGCLMSVLLEETKSVYTVGFIHFLYNLFARV